MTAGMDLGLQGVAALVTGAGSGIGRATAQLLAENGASVVALDLNAEASRQTADEIIASGGNAISVTANVTNEGEVLAAIAEGEAAFGTIRVLVNNAGIGDRRPALEMDLESWKRVIDVNLNAVFLVTQAVARGMVAAGGGGSIVSIASVGGLTGVGNLTSYVAAKHGVVGLTRTLALELAPHKVRVNAVAPGTIATNMTAALLSSEGGTARTIAAHPIGRVGDPSEIAAAVVFLASERASFVTGSVMPVDGGFLAGKFA